MLAGVSHRTQKNKQERGYTQRLGPYTLRRNKKETNIVVYKPWTILAKFGMYIESGINFSK